MTMRELLALLEAAPAPGSKAWLAGVRKWWGQWVKGAARVAKIRDVKDRDKVLAWFAEGEARIVALIEALVRAPGLSTMQDLAKVAVRDIDRLGSGGPGLKLPAKVAGRKLAEAPNMKVLPYLEAARERLRTRRRAEETWFQTDYPQTAADLRTQALHGGASEATYGVGRDLNAWQASVEALGLEVGEIDREVQAAFRAFAQIATKAGLDVERAMAQAVPLEYQVGAVKVLVVPGAVGDLRRQVRAAEGGLGDQQVDAQTAQTVLGGLQQAQRALQQRGFGALWMGKVYVVPREQAVEFTKAKSGERFLSAGHYHSGGDAVMVNPKPSWQERDVAELMVHELGHRYWFKVMKAGARARFAAWFDPRSKADQEREGPQAAYVPAPTAYGAESAVEEFAETFAAYVLGRYEGVVLTGPQRARFEALALGRAAASEAAGGAMGALLREFADRTAGRR